MVGQFAHYASIRCLTTLFKTTSEQRTLDEVDGYSLSGAFDVPSKNSHAYK